MEKAKALTKYAQENRKNMTKEESRLWYQFLRKYPVPFHRQYVVGSYILDFFCYQAMLAIELDGSQHYLPEGMAQDAQRTAVLEEKGIKVLRFSNADVLQYFRRVCEKIDMEVNERMEQLQNR